MNQYPQVTFNIGMTEAPDETAQGDWLNLVSRAGFSFLMAHVNYLRDGQFTIERIEEPGQRDAVSLTMLRVRPVKAGKATHPTTTSTGSSQRCRRRRPPRQRPRPGGGARPAAMRAARSPRECSGGCSTRST